MKAFVPALISTLCASFTQAALLYSESFDYGSSTQNIVNVSNWVTGSGVVDYDHDGGLSHPQLELESSGSIHHNFASGTRGGTNSDASFNPFPSDSAGAEYWIAGLLQINNHSGNTQVLFNNGQSVNRWGFGVDGSGNVILRASNNGGAETALDTGIDAAADGSSYLFLSRGTVGTGSSPTNSIVDFWFNPADTSSVANLGAADFSTGADSKFGRDSGSYNSASISLGFQNRADEIRFGESLEDVIGAAIPEPGTFSLLLTAMGCFLLFRRKR